MNNIIKNTNIDELVDRVSQKFGYDDELNGILKRIIPSMTKDKSDEVNKMVFSALERVKIFVLDENPTGEQVEKCRQEIMGDVNKGVKFIEEDMGEYSKKVAAGAYVNEPVFDDDMNIIDRRGFLYVSRLSKYNSLTDIYGTTINLSHLIHELGHACASEKEEFVQNEDGSFTNNVGSCAMYSKIDKDKREVIPMGYDGLLQEEALNSIEEENILCDMLNIDSINELKAKGYVPSNYQGFITDIMRSYVEKFGKEDFYKYRYLKDREALRDIEKSLEDTEAWKTLKTNEYTENKKAKFDRINELEVTDGAKRLIKGVIEEYRDVYFPDNTKFTPMQKLENVFTQVYNFGTAKYNFGIMGSEHNMEIYQDVMISMISEGYAPKNQAKEVVKEDKEVEKNGFLSELKDGVKTDEEMAHEKNGASEKEDKEKVVEDKTIE